MTRRIISNTSTNEAVIKKSLFIGVCAHVKSIEDFQNFLYKYQDTSATHNCWAYRIGNEYRFNDDGEPSGTAGKPILAAIDGAEFDYLGALVIRHYGGIKLGTGGLARAYGGTIAKNLQVAAHSIHVPTVSVFVQIPFEFSQSLFKVSTEFKAQVTNQSFNESGLSGEVVIAEEKLKAFKQSLINTSKGQARFNQI